MIKTSYSRISDFDRNGPSALLEREHISGTGVSFGSLVDDLISGVDVNDNYIFYDETTPLTDTVRKLADAVIEIAKEEDVSGIDTDYVLRVRKERNFYARLVDMKTIIGKFDNPSFWNYVEAHFVANKTDRRILSSELHSQAILCVDTLKTHSHTRNVFSGDVHYQEPFEVELEGVLVRGIIDMVSIDHETKTIQFRDLKTGAGTYNEFLYSSFYKYRYFIQSYLYMHAFQQVCEAHCLVGYKLLDFQFVYIGRKQNVPVILNISDSFQMKVESGFTSRYNVQYRGVKELIELIKWHYKYQEFEYSKALLDANGLIEIDSI